MPSYRMIVNGKRAETCAWYMILSLLFLTSSFEFRLIVHSALAWHNTYRESYFEELCRICTGQNRVLCFGKNRIAVYNTLVCSVYGWFAMGRFIHKRVLSSLLTFNRMSSYMRNCHDVDLISTSSYCTHNILFLMRKVSPYYKVVQPFTTFT